MSKHSDVPDDLQRLDHWLTWDPTTDRKQPYWGSETVSWSDPDEWHSFTQAVEKADERPEWGIGYVCAVNNDDCPMGVISVIDLDGAADPDDRPKDWVPSLQPFFDRDAYIEWSRSHAEPGDSGLHIPVAGSPPDWWSDVQGDGDHEGIDLLTNKFCIVTGDRMQGCGNEIPGWDDDLEGWLADAYENITGETAPPRRNQDITDSGSNGSYKDDGDWLDEETVDDALSHIDPGCSYEKWRNIGFGLADYFTSSTAKRLFDNWSRRSSKYDREAEKLIEDIADRGSGDVTIGTVIYHAKQAGWSPEFGGNIDAPTADELVTRHTDGSKGPVLEAKETATNTDDAPGATDGGTDTINPTTGDAGPQIDAGVDERVRERLQTEVLMPLDPEDDNVESIDRDVAVDRTARILNEELAFVRPRDDTRAWRDTLYNYVPEEGIYEPHGRAEIERRIERILGAVVNNQFINEVVGKVERLSRVRAKRLSEPAERLVVENGILNLTTGELSPHTPAEYHKRRVGIEYDPNSECPEIDDFLHDVVNEDDVPRLYRFIAHTLYRDYPGNKAAMLLGEGRNGKSVFLDLIQGFLGNWNVSNQSLSQLNENKWSPARLNGQLANIVSDMSDQSPDSMQMFKQLTGNDSVEADVKFENPIQFTNHATMMFACNEMPVLHDDTRGNWRRWQLIKFPNTFKDDDPNAKDEVPKEVLEDRLYDEDEFKGLLAKCVEEIRRYNETNEFFPDADGWEETRSKMRRAAEPVFDFATVCLRPDPDGELEKGLVRAAYNEYATQEGLTKLSREEFGRRLLGLSDYNIDAKRPREDGQRVQVYEGLSFSDRGRSLLGLDGGTEESQSQLDSDGLDGPPEDADDLQADAQRLHKIMRDDGASEYDRGKLLAAAGERFDMDPDRAESAIRKGCKMGILATPEDHRIQRM